MMYEKTLLYITSTMDFNWMKNHASPILIAFLPSSPWRRFRPPGKSTRLRSPNRFARQDRPADFSASRLNDRLSHHDPRSITEDPTAGCRDRALPSSFSQEVRAVIAAKYEQAPPKLVGLLANADPAARKCASHVPRAPP
jgi:hypothetical protein